MPKTWYFMVFLAMFCSRVSTCCVDFVWICGSFLNSNHFFFVDTSGSQLCKARADPNLPDPYMGETPLHRAVLGPHRKASRSSHVPGGPGASCELSSKQLGSSYFITFQYISELLCYYIMYKHLLSVVVSACLFDHLFKRVMFQSFTYIQRRPFSRAVPPSSELSD